MSACATPAIDALEAALEAVSRIDVGDLDTSEVGDGLVRLGRARNRLEGECARWLHPFEQRRGHREDGAVSIVAWTADRCRMSANHAAALVTTARHLPQLPATAAALHDGSIGFQHAAVIARCADDAGDEPVREHETALVDAARTLGVRDLKLVTERLRDCLDHESALGDEEREQARRRLHLSQTLGGMFRIDGWLTRETGAALSTVLNALMPPLPDEHRTAAQRRHDALGEMVIRHLDSGTLPRTHGERPHLHVTVPLASLRDRPGSPGGELDWGGYVIRETAQRIACDAVCTEITVDEDGRVIHVGRPKRNIPARVRRAVLARDRGCRVRGCDRPREWCDLHHLQWRSRDGGHTQSNIRLVCRPHHGLMHEGRRRIRLLPDGSLELEPP
ncbi:MAG TPA: DUF222 domain-containing protein [Candidatus Dormibacteraeota bacterium]